MPRPPSILASILSLALVACGGATEAPEALAPPAPPGPSPATAPGTAPAPAANAPDPASSLGKLRSIPTDLDDPIAHAICADIATYRSGTFTADPSLGLDDATSVSATIDDFQPADAPHALSGLTLTFHRPSGRGVDRAHGRYVEESARMWRLVPGGDFPALEVGVYEDRDVSRFDARSVCYADALGAQGDEVHDASISGAKLVVRAHTDTRLQGTITTKEGARLDFDAPVAIARFPKEGPICCLADEAPLAPKLAPACAVRPAGTFVAEGALSFGADTKLEVYTDKRYLDGAHLGVFLRLELRGSTTTSMGPYGELRHRRRTTLTAPLETAYPEVPPGTYDVQPTHDERDEACYANGLGFATSLPSNVASGPGRLTITASSDREIAGTLELPGATATDPPQRLEFQAPITPTPDEPEIYPRCCRD